MVEGIEDAGVTGWLVENVPGTTPPFSFDLIAGGRSNLTFRVTDAAGRSMALRRPPVSHVLPTAHDMAREHRVVSALHAQAFPVPTPLGYCDDPAVNGAPFWVMSFVEGHILRTERDSEALSFPARATASESLVDTLALLHSYDPDAVGLGDFGRHEGYVARQLRRWHTQFGESPIGGEPGPAIIDEVHDALAAGIPEQQGVGIVHGDYRLDNTVVDDGGRVLAVLDWELCTLGDPLADLGMLLVYWVDPGSDGEALTGVAPTRTEGFATKAEVVARYAAASERDLSRLEFYVALGYWKLACILQGVAHRYAAGAGGGDRSGVERFGDQVRWLGERAGSALDRT